MMAHSDDEDPRLRTLSDKAQAALRDAGWITRHVGSLSGVDGPPFSYTIGLHDKGLPELIVVGLEVPHAEALLSVIAHKMFEGVRAGQFVIDELRYQIWLIGGDSDLIGSEYALAAATRSEGAHGTSRCAGRTTRRARIPGRLGTRQRSGSCSRY